MKNVKIKNNVYFLFIFCFLFLGCNDSKNNLKSNSVIKNRFLKKTHLELKIDLSNYGTYEVNVENWKHHLSDTVAYFNITLKNLKKAPFIIKTHLVATNIPFVIEYRKLEKKDKFRNGSKTEYINLNIVQQFNTIYNDSIVFKLNNNADHLGVEQVFNVGYQKVGGRSLCEIPFEWQRDTLVLSNPQKKHVCCIEVNR